MAALAPTVLVVDDSPAMVRYLRTFLESESFNVESAAHGAEALARLRDGCDPDVLLLDLQMPGMDGLETLRHVRAMRPELSVVMCSGVDDTTTAAAALALGACAYLVKPVQPLYLSAALARCLQSSRAEALDDCAHNVITLPGPTH